MDDSWGYPILGNIHTDVSCCIAVTHAAGIALSFPGGRWIATPKCPGDAAKEELLEKLMRKRYSIYRYTVAKIYIYIHHKYLIIKIVCGSFYNSPSFTSADSSDYIPKLAENSGQEYRL